MGSVLQHTGRGPVRAAPQTTGHVPKDSRAWLLSVCGCISLGHMEGTLAADTQEKVPLPPSILACCEFSRHELWG